MGKCSKQGEEVKGGTEYWGGGISTEKTQTSQITSKTNLYSKFHRKFENGKVFIVEGICSGG